MFAVHFQICTPIISFGLLRAGKVDRDSAEGVEEFCYCGVGGGVFVGCVVVSVWGSWSGGE